MIGALSFGGVSRFVALVRFDRPPWPTVAVLLTTTALGCAASDAVAAPAFGPPVDVSPAGEVSAQAPSAAYEGSGTLQVGWSTLSPDETSVLASARRPPGAAFAAADDLAIAEGQLEGPVFAATPAGQIVAAWAETRDERAQVFAALLGPSGNPGVVIGVSDADDDASEPAIAVGADGRAAIAWVITDPESGDSEVQAVHGVLGLGMATHPVSGDSAGNVGEPDVAFDGAGALQVAFTRFLEDGASVQVGAETPSGAFAAARTVSGGAADAEQPSIAAAPAGGLAIAWTQFEGEASEHVFIGVEAAPGAPVVAAGVPGGGQTRGAQLDVDPATSTLTAAWIRSTGSGPAAALVASRTASGQLEAPVVVSGGDDVSALDLAFSARGDAVLAWQRTLDEESSDVRAAVFDAPAAPPPPPPPAPPPPPPPAVAPPPAPAVPLLLTSFAVDPSCIRYGAPFSGVRKRLRFSFVLSEPATVRLRIQQRLNSHAQRVCPPVRVKGAAGQLGPPALLDVPSGVGPGSTLVGDEGEAVAASAAVRRRSVTLTRRVSAGRSRIVLHQAPTTFAPGTYVVTAAATATDGRRSAPLKVKFWVLQAPRAR